MDDAETIRKKVMKAVTDSGPTTPNSESLRLLKTFSPFLILCRPKILINALTRNGTTVLSDICDLKKQLAEDIAKFNAPIRERINEYSQDIEFLDRVAKIGAEKPEKVLQKTLEEVRKTIDSEFNRRYIQENPPLFLFSIPETKLK